MKLFKNIGSWFATIFKVWRRQFYLVFSDAGVMLFFFALPTLYPVVYTLIYNPEIVKDIPVVMVDDSRTAQSRELTRMIDATQSMKIYDVVPNMSDAKELMHSHKVHAVFHIPEDYARNMGRGTQATVDFYSDMSLLLRYRAMLSSITEIEMALATRMQSQKIEDLGLMAETVVGGDDPTPLESETYMLGDPTSGFASFVIPGILVLILQQSMVLGVTMMAAGRRERRRRNGGIDPLQVPATAGEGLLGRMFCYLTLYIPLILYIFFYIPHMFSLPHIGSLWQYLLFITPMMIASVFMGETLGIFVSERETSMTVIVFTSVIFLFLSGLTWPRYAMNGFWQLVGDFIPAVWGVEGFIRMNSNGSTLAEQSHPYCMLWLLVLFYYITAWLIERYNTAPQRRMAKMSNQT